MLYHSKDKVNNCGKGHFTVSPLSNNVLGKKNYTRFQTNNDRAKT